MISSLLALPTYTTIFRRILAYLIDCTLLFAGVLVTQFGLYALTSGSFHNHIHTWSQIEGWIFLSVVLPSWLYFSLCECGPFHATLGKRALSLSVVASSHNSLDFKQALLRNAIKLFPWFLVHLGMFFPTSTGFTSLYAPNATGDTALAYTFIATAYTLIFAYLIVLPFTHGQRSIHDLFTHAIVMPYPITRIIKQAASL